MKSNSVQRRFRSFLLAWLIRGPLTLAADPAVGPAEEPLRIQSVQADVGSITLGWTGGRPMYQVQRRSGVAADWVDVGAPTSETRMNVPLAGEAGQFRVVSDASARYEVVFDATWSAATHPGAWPASAHWSGLVGGVHGAGVEFWREGALASEGIRLMAERGVQATLASEVDGAIRAGTADFVLRGGGIPTSPGTVRYEFPRAMTRRFPRVTLCSMVAPSPDWFVGVSGLSLIEDGRWVRELSVPLDSFDAGTDSGVDFTSPDLVTAPRGVITRHEGYPARIDGRRVPFGTFTFRRLD